MNSTELKLNIIKKSPGIFINTSEDSFCLNHKHVELLKNEIPVSPKGRSRICVHKSNDELIHQMVIAMPHDHYVQAHKHTGKSESYQVIEGEAMFVEFDNQASIKLVYFLNAENCFLKTTIGQYHTLIVLSEFFVFMETTNGPFEESANFFAPWAPSENEHEVIAKYKVDLKKNALSFSKNNGHNSNQSLKIKTP